jgi:hypothetical protein
MVLHNTFILVLKEVPIMVKQKEKNILYSRFVLEGYGDIAEFIRITKIDLQFETLRRILYLGQETSPPTAMILMKHLRFTPDEIAKYLTDTWPDRKTADLASLISTSDIIPLAPWEQVWLDLGRRLREKDQTTFERAVDGLHVYGKSIGLDFSEEVAQIIGR